MRSCLLVFFLKLLAQTPSEKLREFQICKVQTFWRNHIILVHKYNHGYSRKPSAFSSIAFSIGMQILNMIGAVEREAAGLETKPWHTW